MRKLDSAHLRPPMNLSVQLHFICPTWSVMHSACSKIISDAFSQMFCMHTRPNKCFCYFSLFYNFSEMNFRKNKQFSVCYQLCGFEIKTLPTGMQLEYKKKPDTPFCMVHIQACMPTCSCLHQLVVLLRHTMSSFLVACWYMAHTLNLNQQNISHDSVLFCIWKHCTWYTQRHSERNQVGRLNGNSIHQMMMNTEKAWNQVCMTMYN